MLLAAAYAFSFVGMTLRGFGWCVIPLWAGAFLALLPIATESYRPRPFWGARWPFQPQVPRWIKWGTAVVFALFVASLLTSGAMVGDAHVKDGIYMLDRKTFAPIEISLQTYIAVCEAQVRFATSSLLFGWFQAAGLWWTELQRAQALTSAR